MATTGRGRGATRVVVAGLLIVLLTFAAVLLADVSGADARDPDTADPADPADTTDPADAESAPASTAPASTAGPRLLSVGPLTSGALARAVEVTEVLVDAATPSPPSVYCPVPGSEFVDSWGFARSGGRRHRGVDMMAPYGTPVLAPVDGTVEASRSALGGLTFNLSDAAGNELSGAHLASLDVTGPVEAGQQIGTVGSTGNAGAPHLHFEVEPAGRGTVNPYPFAHNWCTTDFSAPGAAPLLP